MILIWGVPDTSCWAIGIAYLSSHCWQAGNEDLIAMQRRLDSYATQQQLVSALVLFSFFFGFGLWRIKMRVMLMHQGLGDATKDPDM